MRFSTNLVLVAGISGVVASPPHIRRSRRHARGQGRAVTAELGERAGAASSPTSGVWQEIVTSTFISELGPAGTELTMQVLASLLRKPRQRPRLSPSPSPHLKHSLSHKRITTTLSPMPHQLRRPLRSNLAPSTLLACRLVDPFHLDQARRAIPDLISAYSARPFSQFPLPPLGRCLRASRAEHSLPRSS